MTIRQIRSLGFVGSYRTRDGIAVRCDSCEALVINGHPTHERGCPNAPRVNPAHECAGCNTFIPATFKYCAGCA